MRLRGPIAVRWRPRLWASVCFLVAATALAPAAILVLRNAMGVLSPLAPLEAALGGVLVGLGVDALLAGWWVLQDAEGGPI